MSQRNLGLAHESSAGSWTNRMPVFVWAFAMTLVLATLVLPCTSSANARWRELWTDGFEHSMNEGWEVAAFMHGDRIGVVQEGFTEPRHALPRCDNNVLYGSSLDREAGHGFAARSPGFADLGIDELAKAYRMEFRYMLIGSDVCFTTPLASPDAILVVSECLSSGDRAILGVVETDYSGFRPIAEIPVDQWVDLRVDVQLIEATGERVVNVYVDGYLADNALHTERSGYEGIVFMDLPALPVALAEDGSRPHEHVGYFGSGYWDDVRLSVLERQPTISGKQTDEIQVAPSPFNPSTSLRMQLLQSSDLNVVVFDARGRRVRTLWQGVHGSGPVDLPWDGRDDMGREVSSGVYLFRVVSSQGEQVVRAVLVR